MSDLQEALKARDEAQAACTAWKLAFECIEAHIRDRMAMKDDAEPRVYLQIIKTAVDNINRESAAIVAARWADGTRYQIALDKVSRDRDDLLAALKLILPLAKGYAPKGQSKEARQTCNEWIAAAIAAVERAEGTP